MNLFNSIDIYCERTNATLLAEPINLFTNLAFLISAYFGCLLVRNIDRNDNFKKQLYILVALTFSIGIGSSLFHSFAKTWAELLDVIPITFFIFYYWYCMQKTLFSQTTIKAIAYVFVLSSISSLIIYLLPPLPILKAYLLPLGLLFGLGIIIQKKYKESLLLKVATLFTISLTFRSIDEPLCHFIPFGTHFMWHICNALVLYFCIYVLVLINDKESFSS